MQNPKSEIRNPREGRDPKAEVEPFDARGEFWGDDGEILKEEAPQWGSDLMERTALFGESILRFAKKVPQNPANNRLIDQVVGAGTSVGANYREADDSVSGKDFKKSIGTCRKESKETMYWLRMIATAEPSLINEARVLWREAKELNLIFGAIWRK